jgi:hypothetical protein
MGNHHGNQQLIIPKTIWLDNMKMDIKEVGCKDEK